MQTGGGIYLLLIIKLSSGMRSRLGLRPPVQALRHGMIGMDAQKREAQAINRANMPAGAYPAPLLKK
jgi:hypothetical protein